MALQDLTPQLRTRLVRVERVVGLFLAVAALLLVAALSFYLFKSAQNKGWFLEKALYFTFVENAAGLKVGDKVKLMGFPAGEITEITPEAPDGYYNVFVGFRIMEPYYGYIWSDSTARITAADLLGNRAIEVTKGGDKGHATFVEYPLRSLVLDTARSASTNQSLRLAEEIVDTARPEPIAKLDQSLSEVNFSLVAQAGIQTVTVLDRSTKRRNITAVFNPTLKRYEPISKGFKGFNLVPHESPSLTDTLERVIKDIEVSLPHFFQLTNQLVTVLSNTASMTARADLLLTSAQPSVDHINEITRNLRNPDGALGNWLLPTNLHRQLDTTLLSAHIALTNATLALTNINQRLDETLLTLNDSLENLGNITSNLNSQVQLNTNILSSISQLVVHADQFVQGLKKHWLFRKSFRSEFETNAPPRKLTRPPARQGERP